MKPTSDQMNKSIKIGVSSCLLGERVRYDGSYEELFMKGLTLQK